MKFELTGKKLFKWVPRPLQTKVCWWMYRLLVNGHVDAYFQLTTPFGTYKYSNFTNIPLCIIDQNSTERYDVGLEDVEVVYVFGEQ